MIDHRLQTLRVLRERGTVTAAAEALHLTPSTVSQQLKQLARDLGVELLEAQGRRVRLTPAAHTVLRHADVLSAQWERARADLAEHRSGTSGQVRFCSVSSALAMLVAPAAARLRAEHPGLNVRMSEQDSEDAAHLLLAHRADIAVVIPSEEVPGPDDARFTLSTLLDEPQDLLVPAGHPLARGAAARLADAAGEAWIGYPDRRDQHQLLLAACAAAGYVPRIAHEANEWFAVSSLVAHGFGVALVPRLAPLPPRDEAVRVPLRGSPVPKRRLVACVRRGSERQPPIAHGLAALRGVAGGRLS
ncbi:LysR substrate-binding domain-containing protein [Actinomadura opuntiae]|uniref:LysR substrate-binding domain-containing protein n=1 Tax=Actinomadura sp. OS1-43 TaxID=604315 RepID=UPI00255A9556|nr:LysR substrate-binding domain-containing protein [Actinomadura sp. OS1-43]MDL4815181.1 LysR substrate-binding domain-containing protein [Actinomadura sp. OS1-43]